MDRREMLGTLGATAAGLAAMAAGDAYAEAPQKKGHDEHDAMSQKTGKTCSACMNACNEGFHHCHEQLAAGKKEYAAAAHLCVDTAEMCACAAALCARVSPLMGHCCEACAKCCDACIEECEKLKDSELKGVIAACRTAAKECRDMAKMMSGGGK